MEKKIMSSRPKNTKEFRKNLAEEFIKSLETESNWQKGWQGPAHMNAVTKKRYKGINKFHLSLIAIEKGYKDPRWATMVQIMDKKGIYHPNEKWHLKKGSKASYVEYWYPYNIEEKIAYTWEEYRKKIKANNTTIEEFTLLSRYYAVYNAEEIEGMPELELPKNDINITDVVTKLSKNMDVPILYDGGDQAYYMPSNDTIHLPKPEVFDSDYEFNHTALHELAHSTGNEKRLNRSQISIFGSEDYAFEELIAEMSSSFMSVNLDVEISKYHIENHKAYLKNWTESIRKDPDILVKAVKEAEKVATYMDYQAELITEKEYKKVFNSTLTVSNNDIDKAKENKESKDINERISYNVGATLKDILAPYKEKVDNHSLLEKAPDSGNLVKDEEIER